MVDAADLPSTTGVYLFKKGDLILYVGKSVNIKVRVKSHIENAKIDIKESLIVQNAEKIEYIVTDSEFKAILLEAQLIQRHHPKYNVIWRDNKSYLYIKVTLKENYPKILLVRKPRFARISRSKENDGKSLYFGPYSSVRTASKLLKEIRKLIPFCTQKNISNKPCFYSKIGLCNPCPNEIDARLRMKDVKKGEELKKEYKKNIRSVIKILSGNVKKVLDDFYKRLRILTKGKNYEEAILLRDKIFRFEQLLYSKSFHDELTTSYNQSEEARALLLLLLRKYFSEISVLNRIECYDISNTSQKMGTASMVVLRNGLIQKSEYRKFRIKNKMLRSDFEMLEEVLRRRFKQDWEYPNLLVIDGGKPQVRTVLRVLSSLEVSIPVIGIAKNPDRLIIGINGLPTVYFLMENKAFNLLRLIRDESHRFARKYHLFLKDRNFLI